MNWDSEESTKIYRSSPLQMLRNVLCVAVPLTIMSSIPAPCFDGSAAGYLIPAGICLFAVICVRLLGYVKATIRDGELVVRAPLKWTKRFDLARSSFSTKVIENRISFWLAAFFCIVPPVAFVLYLIIDGGTVRWDKLLILVGVFTCTFGSTLLFTWLHFRRRNRSMPESIVVDGSSLTIDDKRYAFSDIMRIKVTPPDYHRNGNSSNRAMVIAEEFGQKKYALGRCMRRGHWKAVFEDYERLCGMLESAAEKHNFEFLYAL